jgi:hypothetical protein
VSVPKTRPTHAAGGIRIAPRRADSADDLDVGVDGRAGRIADNRGVEAFLQGARACRKYGRRTAGRAGPWLALPYFALGSRAREQAKARLTDRIASRGTDRRGRAHRPTAIREAIAAYEQAGYDELMLFPCNADLAQVQLLAQAVR